MPPSHTAFLSLVQLEAERSSRLHQLNPSWHHNLGLLIEELTEFQKEVFLKSSHRDSQNALGELVQIASVAMRAAQALDLI